jgi:uncharacterized phage protein (TIGR01671 family)
MREIKFRAWSKEEKEMIYTKDDTGVFPKCGVVDAYDGFGVSFEQRISASKLEIMEFTGLHDKNGTEIYEGDIFQYDGDDDHRINYVGYQQTKIGFIQGVQGGFELFIKYPKYLRIDFQEICFTSALKPGNPIPQHLKRQLIDDFEIIGNIYENPELLETGK